MVGKMEVRAGLKLGIKAIKTCQNRGRSSVRSWEEALVAAQIEAIIEIVTEKRGQHRFGGQKWGHLVGGIEVEGVGRGI